MMFVSCRITLCHKVQNYTTHSLVKAGEIECNSYLCIAIFMFHDSRVS